MTACHNQRNSLTKTRRLVRSPIAACLLGPAILLAAGCTRDMRLSGGAAPGSGEVLLFAAASTGDALDAVRTAYRQETGTAVAASYAATSTLAEQVLSGAPADVFVSANTQWADRLEEKGQVAARQDLLGNRLVLIVPADSAAKISRLEDLLESTVQHIALAAPESVPAGIYAKKALTELGLWAKLKDRVVSAADVRQALAMVETGAAEAGLVYSTDAAASTSVRVVLAVDESLTGPIVYPVLLLKSAQGRGEAEAFYRFLFSPTAAAIFGKHGFEVRSSRRDGP